MAKLNLKVNDKVVFNNQPDATIFQIVAMQETNIHVAELKPDGSKYFPQWADVSMIVRKVS